MRPDSPTCPTCGGPLVTGRKHVCLPRYRVWRDGADEKTGRVIYASAEVLAALRWADLEDESDPEAKIARGEYVIVRVRTVGSPWVYTIQVTGEFERRYSADPPDPIDEEELPEAV